MGQWRIIGAPPVCKGAFRRHCINRMKDGAESGWSGWEVSPLHRTFISVVHTESEKGLPRCSTVRGQTLPLRFGLKWSKKDKVTLTFFKYAQLFQPDKENK